MRHTLPSHRSSMSLHRSPPYLEGSDDVKLFTALQESLRRKLEQQSSGQGSGGRQNVLYRPSCADCAACMSARINRGPRLQPSKGPKAQRSNARTQGIAATWATRHGPPEDNTICFATPIFDSRPMRWGGMADMDVFEFAAMIEKHRSASRCDRIHDKQTRD